jgi:DNA-directed RNA polymerase specialized sigma24 family protein
MMLSVHALMQEAQVPVRARRKRPAGSAREERKLLEAAILRLPDEARLVLALRYYESARPRHIARVLGVEEPEARSLLADAVRQVVREMEAIGAEAARPRRRNGRRSERA